MENIKVVLTHHAMLDCIPLRFGKVLKNKFAQLQATVDEVESRKQKPEEQRSGNQHFVGHLIQNEQILISNARFVLAKQNNYDYNRPIISIMRKQIGLATRAVSDLIRSYREADDITPQQIADHLYPLYQEGQLEDEQKIFKALVDLEIADAKDTFQDKIQKIMLENEQKVNEEVKKRLSLENKIRELEEQMKQSDKSNDPQYKGEQIDLSPIGTLANVRVGTRTNYNGREIRCTFLEFEEPTMPVRKMDQWADHDGQKTEKAKNKLGSLSEGIGFSRGNISPSSVISMISTS